jgi:hypothetical protein
MQITAQEMKLIDRLRKEEQRWSRTRWVLLAMVILILAIYGFIGGQLIGMTKAEAHEFGDEAKGVPVSVQLLGIVERSQTVTFAVSLFWPLLLIGFCGAGWLIALLIRDWHGNVQRMLLLRLLDAQQKHDHAA